MDDYFFFRCKSKKSVKALQALWMRGEGRGGAVNVIFIFVFESSSKRSKFVLFW